MRAVQNSKQLLVVMAVVVLAVVVMPIALAGAAGGKPAAVAKSVKQLKKQVRSLQQQIAGLQDQVNAPRPASGPAGGDLTGAYPNPLVKAGAILTDRIADNAVTTPKIANGAVTLEKIGDNAVTSPKIADSSVTTSKIADGSVNPEDLGTESIGSRALKPVIAVIGPGVNISAGVPKQTHVVCPAGTTLIAAGYAWTDEEPNSILTNAPSNAAPNSTWFVEGMVKEGSNSLYAWANCLTGGD